jgi:hypothetical protein
MNDWPGWLPSLVLLAEQGNDWKKYIDVVYAVFYSDFIASQPKYRNRWVRCRRDLTTGGKECGFWHCVSSGSDETNRVPDLRRCERIGWVRAVIENSMKRQVEVWTRDDGRRGRRVHLWFNEEYLVVLGVRRNGDRYQLVTAFCTDRAHTIDKKRRERDQYKNG